MSSQAASLSQTGLPQRQAVEDPQERTAPPHRLPRHPDRFPALPRGRHAAGGIGADEVSSIQRGRVCGAMMLCLAEHDFDGVFMSELAEQAKVSLQDLYRRFKHGKPEVFLCCFEQVAHASLHRLALAGEHADPLGRLHARVLEFVQAVCEQPVAARVLLVEPFAVGADAIERMRFHQRRLEQMLAADLRELGGLPLIARGIVAGVAHLARQALMEQRLGELAEQSAPIAEWACCLAAARAAPPPLSPPMAFCATKLLHQAGRVRENRREWVLAAALTVLERRGYPLLSEREVRTEAQITCRELASHFKDEQQIFTAVIEQLWKSTLRYAERAGRSGARDWPQLVARTVCELTGSFAIDALLARLACQELPAAGASGLALRERLTRELAERLRKSAPAEQPISAPAAQASIAACWAILSGRINEGRAQHLPAHAPLLSFIALSPAIGPAAAAEALAMPAPQIRTKAGSAR